MDFFSWFIVHLPYNTTITSAVDGNNNPVSNGGSTSSTSITFTVQAPAGSNPVAGFQCSLDNSPFSSCGIATNNAGTITFNILVKGSHTVKIVAVDSQGNVDSTPATFSWFITQQQIPPVANAGSDQEVQSSQIVHLDGSASSDPSGFTPLAYQWTQTSGPSMSLSNSNSATPSFTAPHVSDETDLTFQLVVTNSKGLSSSPSSVTITVTPPVHSVPPVSNAGPNPRVQSFQTVL